ncbi:MAG TPA: ABC-2 family transporter protein [Polyangiaceae bacterium]|jgi:ABC-2 type transport system permease protein|nr:ABC-2 family transporter protein [Polyangiaceae bacterium]
MASLKFLGVLLGTNLRASLALRGAFLLQAAFMALNNLLYLAVWLVFFRRFHDIGGFGARDMELCYGIVACGFGLAVALAGGLREVSKLIVEGSLDSYLTQPKPVLLSVLCSRTLASGWGDLASGLALIALSGQVTALHLPFLLIAIAISAVVFVASGVLFHSAAFWLGKVDSLARMLWDFVITFSIYPEPIFGGRVRLLLYTLIPAAFAGSLPARLAREPSASHFAAAFGGALAVSSAALLVFERGLRRYESGSQIGAR